MILSDRISALDDATAIATVLRLARAIATIDVPTVLEVATLAQLREQAGLEVNSHNSGSSGELARATLLMAADDPEAAMAIESMLDAAPGGQFAAVETAVLVAAVLIVLQTHIRFERDKTGQWTVKLEKKPTDIALLKDFVRKLISFH